MNKMKLDLDLMQRLSIDPEACIKGTPMVPIHQNTLIELVAWAREGVLASTTPTPKSLSTETRKKMVELLGRIRKMQKHSYPWDVINDCEELLDRMVLELMP